MDNLSIIHVSAWAKAFTQFRLPLITKLKNAVRRQVIYCPYDPVHFEELRARGFEVQEGRISPAFGFSLLSAMFRLYGYLRNEKFDMLIAHQPIGALVGIIAARLAAVPIKIYSTGGLRHVPGNPSMANHIVLWGEHRLIKWSNGVFVVNGEDESFLRSLPDVREKVYYVGPRGGSGIDIERFNPLKRKANRQASREKLGISDETVVLGYTGRYVWEKGFREMIRAAQLMRAHHDDFVFIAFGEGQQKEEIESYARDSSVADIFRFEGYRRNIEYWMSAFDLFILPSYREGLSVSLLEAMASGLPCIASDIRGSRELIENGEDGLLIEAGDANALAQAIDALSGNKDAQLSFGEKAASKVAHHFSEDVLLEKTISIVRALGAGVHRASERGPVQSGP